MCSSAHPRGLSVHMDGARFANAVASSGSSPAELTWRAGVDLLSLRRHQGRCHGSAEAVIVFTDELARRPRTTPQAFRPPAVKAAIRVGTVQRMARRRRLVGACRPRQRDGAPAGSQGLSALGIERTPPGRGEHGLPGLGPAAHDRRPGSWARSTTSNRRRRPTTDRVEVRLVTSWSTSPTDVDRSPDRCPRPALSPVGADGDTAPRVRHRGIRPRGRIAHVPAARRPMEYGGGHPFLGPPRRTLSLLSGSGRSSRTSRRWAWPRRGACGLVARLGGRRADGRPRSGPAPRRPAHAARASPATGGVPDASGGPRRWRDGAPRPGPAPGGARRSSDGGLAVRPGVRAVLRGLPRGGPRVPAGLRATAPAACGDGRAAGLRGPARRGRRRPGSRPSCPTGPADPSTVAEAIRAHAARLGHRLPAATTARFAIILEDTPENGAVWTVERVRRNLVSRLRHHTMWAGVACYPAHAFDAPRSCWTRPRPALDSAREWKQDRIEVADRRVSPASAGLRSAPWAPVELCPDRRRRRHRGPARPTTRPGVADSRATTSRIGTPSTVVIAPRLDVVGVGEDVGHVVHRCSGGVGPLELGQHLVAGASPPSRRRAPRRSAPGGRPVPSKLAKRSSPPRPISSSTRCATDSALEDTAIQRPSLRPVGVARHRVGDARAQALLGLAQQAVQRHQRTHQLEHRLDQVHVHDLAHAGVDRHHRGEGRDQRRHLVGERDRRQQRLAVGLTVDRGEARQRLGLGGERRACRGTGRSGRTR